MICHVIFWNRVINGFVILQFHNTIKCALDVSVDENKML